MILRGLPSQGLAHGTRASQLSLLSFSLYAQDKTQASAQSRKKTVKVWCVLL